MALFRNFGVNRRNRLCGVQKYASAQFLDFLELAENCAFLDRKLISALNEIVDGQRLEKLHSSAAQGSRKNKFAILGVEAPAWQGAKTQEYLDIPSFRNAARRDASASKM